MSLVLNSPYPQKHFGSSLFFLTLRQHDLASTAPPILAQDSNEEILGRICLEQMWGMAVYKKETNFYSSPFFPLRQPDPGPLTATPTPSGNTTVEILG